MAKSKPARTNYAFIDSQNLNLGIQKMGWKMDWRRFREFLRKEYGVGTAYLFIGYVHDNEDMYQKLFDMGYLIVLKPTVESFTEQTSEENNDAQKAAVSGDEPTKKPVIKGNIDAELVLYAMKDIQSYHKAVIVSGDGDFFCLVEYLAAQQKLEKVLVPNWQYSSLYKQFERYIVRLDMLRATLSYREKRRLWGRKQPQKKPPQEA